MQRSLSTWAASLAESSWLVALAGLPVFYNVYSHETFEPDKILLLRSLSALTLVAVIVWCVSNGRAAWTVGERTIWQLPVVRPVCALTAAYLLATVLSIAPSLSVWGSYQRAQGLYTWLSYVMLFVAIVLVLRTRAQRERMVSAVLFASVPAAVYAIIQRFHADPISWGGAPLERVTGMAGNAIFVGGYFMMVMPLTLARVICPRHTGTDLVYRGAYAIVLGLQFVAFICTESRGPTVGLAFGLAGFVAVGAVLRRVRWPVLALAGVAAIAVLVVASRPDQGAGHGGMKRLAQPLAWQGSSVRVRVLIWEGIIDLLRRDPARAVVGHGPETLLLAFTPVFPAALATIERPDVAPDRAHNEVLDTLTTIGAVGCVAELILFAALFLHILRTLGVITTGTQRNRCVITMLSATLVGGLLPIATGRGAFAALGLAGGLATGVLAYVAATALWPGDRSTSLADADATLLTALFAAVLSHFVELQTSLSTSTTRLSFFAFAALAVAIGCSPPSPKQGDTSAGSAPAAQPVVSGLLAALLLIVLTFDFDTPTVSLTLHSLPLAMLFGSTWLFGGLLVSEGSRRWEPRAVGTYVATSTALWLAFVAVFAPRVEMIRALTTRATSAEVLGPHLVDVVALTYVAVLVCTVIIAVALAWQQSSTRDVISWPAMGVAVPLLAAAAWMVVSNAQLSRADCLTNLGALYEREGAWADAVAAHQRALQWAPGQQEYVINLARALMEHARVVAPRDPTQRDADAARAVQLMEGAARANPLSADNASNVARLYRKWARIGEPASRPQRFEHADVAYQQALALWPNNPLLWNERAVLYIERGQFQKMQEMFDRSLAVDPDFVETYVRRAQIFVALKRLDEANADFRTARQRSAMQTSDSRELIKLYRQMGQTDHALAEARAALTNAGPEEQDDLQELIRALEGTSGAPES